MNFSAEETWAKQFLNLIGFDATILCVGGRQNFTNNSWGRENYKPTYKPSIKDLKSADRYDAIWLIKNASLTETDIQDFTMAADNYLKEHGILCLTFILDKPLAEKRKSYISLISQKSELKCFQYYHFTEEKKGANWVALLCANEGSMPISNTPRSRALINHAIVYHNLAVKAHGEIGETLSANKEELSAAQFCAAITNMAFSCEIALKAYLPKSPTTHDLEKIYRMLPVGERINLYLSMSEKLQGRDKQFDELLHEAKDNFIDWRYVFESKNRLEGHLYFLKDFSETLIESIGMDEELEGYESWLQ